MNRQQLAHVVRSASMVVDDDMLIIGSQATLGTYPESALPDAAVASIEVDIAFLDDPDYAKGDLVDAVLGGWCFSRRVLGPSPLAGLAGDVGAVSGGLW